MRTSGRWPAFRVRAELRVRDYLSAAVSEATHEFMAAVNEVGIDSWLAGLVQDSITGIPLFATLLLLVFFGIAVTMVASNTASRWVSAKADFRKYFWLAASTPKSPGPN